MHERTRGQGLRVCAIGLGCMDMSQSYGPNFGDRAPLAVSHREPPNGQRTLFAAGHDYQTQS